MASLTAPSAAVITARATEAPYEIRDARPEDQAAAWSLQRAAFSLPEEGPPPHPGLQEELRVLVRGGRVVSCLTLIHARLCMRGAQLTMGGIRHVATHPEEQNHGYASALMRDTLHVMRLRGLLTSILFPFSFRYYRKFGYELGGNHCHFWCRPNCIPAYAERSGCRPARPEDSLRLCRFQGEMGSSLACGMARHEPRWAAICADPARALVVYTAPSGDLEGFAVTDETRDAYGGRVARVLDLSASTAGAWRGLLGYLSQLPVESVEWFANAGDLAASGLLRSRAPLREGFKPRGIATVRPMFQFRVVDVERALRARAACFPPGSYRLALRVRDEIIADNEQALAIQASASGADVRPARSGDPYLETDIRVFSQLFCGYMSPAEALSQGLATCSSAAAVDVAEQLFPAGEPFISELDRF